MIKQQRAFFSFFRQQKTGRWLSLCFIAVFSHTAIAMDFQSHASIDKTAVDFMAAQLKASDIHASVIHARELDSRLHLKACSQNLVAFLPRGSHLIGRTTVGIKCQDAQPWSIQVPVTVRVMKAIAVAAKLLPRDTILQPQDIRMKTIDLSTLPQGYIDQKQSLIGQKLKRLISAGVAFTPNIITPQDRVKRGQRVTILARSGSMEVRMAGRALTSGAVGEVVKVVNIASRQRREGVVTKSGEVQVDL